MTKVIISSWELHQLPLDPLWRAHYLRMFEEASTCDRAIASDGAATTWHQRFVNRIRIQRNRLALRCSQVTLTLPDPLNIGYVAGVTSSLIVFRNHRSDQSGRVTTSVRVCSLPDFISVCRIETPACGVVAITDGSEPKLVLAIRETNAVQLHDMRSGALIRWWSREFRDITLSAGKRWLALATSRLDPTGRLNWKRESRVATRLCVINMESDHPLAEAVSCVDWAQCRVSQDEASVLCVGVARAEFWSIELQPDGAPRLQLKYRIKLTPGYWCTNPSPAPGDAIPRLTHVRGSQIPTLEVVSRGKLVSLRKFVLKSNSIAVPLERNHIAISHPLGDLEVRRFCEESVERNDSQCRRVASCAHSRVALLNLPGDLRLVAANYRYFVFVERKLPIGRPAQLLVLDFASPPPLPSAAPTLTQRIAKVANSAINWLQWLTRLPLKR